MELAEGNTLLHGAGCREQVVALVSTLCQREIQRGVCWKPSRLCFVPVPASLTCASLHLETCILWVII